MAKDVRGARVLVTGAGRGMGRLYAERAAREGAAAVVLWDVDGAALDEVAHEISRDRDIHRVSTIVDAADADAVARAAADVEEQVGGVDVVLNNAGVVRSNGYFWEQEYGQANHTVAVNLAGPMNVARAFLPGMIARRDVPARLVTIASAAALTPNPRMSVYAASKAGVASWSDSLRVELARAGHAHVRVTTVYPSYVRTGMFDGARGPVLTPVVAPEVVVDAVWAAMLAGRPEVMIPWSVPLARLLRGMLPTGAYDVVAGAMRVYGSMDGFTGRREASGGGAGEVSSGE